MRNDDLSRLKLRLLSRFFQLFFLISDTFLPLRPSRLLYNVV
jgi:hypothetical protein